MWEFNSSVSGRFWLRLLYVASGVTGHGRWNGSERKNSAVKMSLQQRGRHKLIKGTAIVTTATSDFIVMVADKLGYTCPASAGNGERVRSLR